MTEGQPQLVAWEELPPFDMWEGVVGRPVFAAGATMNFVEMEPDLELPAHRHPHQQFGIVISGSILLRVGDMTRELGPRDLFVIPSNVEHSARSGPEGAFALDVFTPEREDFRDAVSSAVANSASTTPADAERSQQR
jgi:quercetin dioxygenase-like cupin family protein